VLALGWSWMPPIYDPVEELLGRLAELAGPERYTLEVELFHFVALPNCTPNCNR
jgi:hypothetical protein